MATPQTVQIVDSKINNRAIGLRLKSWRKKRRLSLAQLALAADINWRRLARLERGDRSLSLVEAGNLARQLHCRIEDLLYPNPNGNIEEIHASDDQHNIGGALADWIGSHCDRAG